MSGQRHFCYGLVIGWLIGVFFGLLAFAHHLGDLKSEAIDCGYAEYDTKTGDWKWRAEKHE